MAQTFFRIIEIAFASYMVPALLLPAVWIAGWLMKNRLGADRQPIRDIERQWRVLFRLFVLWLGLFLGVLAGVPLNRGGVVAIVVCWAIYALTNLLLAWFLLRFTATYALIPAGKAADRVFMRFLGIVITQPLMTAAAFTVLNQVMGVAWNLQVPDLPAIQEGI
ncbi:MAG TPA: hypothetical protein VGO37_18365 [Steroidobacteraceae bacterium]|jgi:hypothetical protein|nr:hypothetical protein [Steroidobacteraceae bacterium]